MTHYTNSNEAQRNDPELLSAIDKELGVLTHILSTLYKRLSVSAELVREGIKLEEEELGQSSALWQTSMHISAATSTLNSMLNGKPSETYIKNIAAYMPPEVAEELKEKYRG